MRIITTAAFALPLDLSGLIGCARRRRGWARVGSQCGAVGSKVQRDFKRGSLSAAGPLRPPPASKDAAAAAATPAAPAAVTATSEPPAPAGAVVVSPGVPSALLVAPSSLPSLSGAFCLAARRATVPGCKRTRAVEAIARAVELLLREFHVSRSAHFVHGGASSVTVFRGSQTSGLVEIAAAPLAASPGTAVATATAAAPELVLVRVDRVKLLDKHPLVPVR